MIRYDKASNTYWMPLNDVALEAMLDQQYDRVPGELRWKPKKGVIETLAKATELAYVVTQGFADEATLAKRQLACFGDSTQPQCGALIRDENGSYCAGCKCGTWQLANLEGIVPKLKWAGLKCPLGRF